MKLTGTSQYSKLLDYQSQEKLYKEIVKYYAEVDEARQSYVKDRWHNSITLIKYYWVILIHRSC